MTLSHKNCIFLNFLSESLKTDTEDLPDQIETGVQFSQTKAKQTNKRPQSEDEPCDRHHTKTRDLWCKKGFLS